MALGSSRSPFKTSIHPFSAQRYTSPCQAVSQGCIGDGTDEADRRFGRFQSSTATESHQRQLAAPVHRWKREWVAPTGMAPESSYKVFKWVRTDVKAQFTGGASEAGDYLTPAPEGNGEEEDEEEGGDEDEDEGEGEGEDEGEGEGAAEGEGKVEGADEEVAKPEGDVKTAEESVPASTAVVEEPAATATLADAPVAPSPAPPASSTEDIVVDAVDPVEPAPAATLTPAAPSPAAALTPAAVTPAVPSPAPAITPAAAAVATPDEPSHDAPIPTHSEIPSNAVEVTNVGPEATEMGAGEAAHSGGVELEGRKEEDGDVVMESKDDVEMSMEEPVEKDEGLVMGEMEPPVPELAVEGADEPAETEKA
ncbi:hypothetical protein IAT38_007850 [Cryptococcus sp. DSM 104549]